MPGGKAVLVEKFVVYSTILMGEELLPYTQLLVAKNQILPIIRGLVCFYRSRDFITVLGDCSLIKVGIFRAS
jgi:hypothetical protein